MYYALVRLNDSGIYHYDLKTDIGVGQTNADTPESYSRVVFVNDNYVYAPVYGKTYGKLTFYGSEKDNTITAKSRADNYIEGGLGSDTITTGMGDDTIYTNANIQDKYDYETASTLNRVYAGDGNDTVIGSKGTDIIYADSDSSSNPSEYRESDYVEGKGGSDVIYGGGNDDILYADSAYSHADTSGDYIVGGKGKDYIAGSDGADTIYGDDEANNGNDWSLFSDSDTINAYGGNDTVYGGNDSDVINGGTGSDTLHGGADNDTLLGGNTLDDLYSEKGYNYLLGGSGFDTYYVSNADVINDADSSGLIMFNDKSLSGKKTKVEGSDDRYEDDNFVYALKYDLDVNELEKEAA
jgi:Ca2+-binding RTX toxin-like protein